MFNFFKKEKTKIIKVELSVSNDCSQDQVYQRLAQKIATIIVNEDKELLNINDRIDKRTSNKIYSASFKIIKIGD